MKISLRKKKTLESQNSSNSFEIRLRMEITLNSFLMFGVLVLKKFRDFSDDLTTSNRVF